MRGARAGAGGEINEVGITDHERPRENRVKKKRVSRVVTTTH
eukprot:COSAG03_NODE_27272_length_254_cov_0.664516_1_plen_41_part_10